MEGSWGEFIRLALLWVSGLAGLAWIVQAVVGWRHFSWGEKMLAVAVPGILIYAMRALHQALALGYVQWSWWLAPLLVGLVSLVAFLLEPFASKDLWWGRRLRTKRKNHDDGPSSTGSSTPVDEP